MTTPTLSDDSAGSPPPRRSAVWLALLLTVLVFASIMATLVHRAVFIQEPSRVLVVRADADWNGIELSVEGGALSSPKTSFFEKLGNYVVPFFLWPGQYTLRVHSGGTELYSKTFDLTNERIVEVDLTRTGISPRSATAPATMPATSPL